MPKPQKTAAVPPDPARAPTETSSKFWGVNWDKRARRWMAYYYDANGKKRGIGQFDTQEDAAHAVNAAIRRAGAYTTLRFRLDNSSWHRNDTDDRRSGAPALSRPNEIRHKKPAAQRVRNSL